MKIKIPDSISKNFSNLSNKALRFYKQSSLKAKKYSPEIKIGLGVISAAGAVITACVATTKFKPIVEDAKEEIIIIREQADLGEIDHREKGKELTHVYIRTAGHIGKLYAPAVTLFAAYLVSTLSGFDDMRKRAATYAAAYIAVTEDFANYRSRVVDKYGEEVDKELKYPSHKEKVLTTVVDENGEAKTIETETTVMDEPPLDFTFVFDRSCSNYPGEDVFAIKVFLSNTERLLNSQLQRTGIQHAYEALEYIGTSTNEASYVLGAIYDDNDPTKQDYVSLGIDDYLSDSGTTDVTPIIHLNYKRLVINEHEKYDKVKKYKDEYRARLGTAGWQNE